MEVYLLCLNALEQLEIQDNLLPKLSVDNQIYVDNIKFPKKRLTALGGRLLLEYVCRIHGIKTFHLSYGTNGKPFFSDVSDFYFNISHSGQYLCLAWSSKEIGIDIEQIRNELPKYPARMLSTVDYSFFQRQAPEEKRNCFFQLWTRKESLIKLHGNSIFQKSKEISISDGEKMHSSMDHAFLLTCQWEDYMISVSTLENVSHLPVKLVTLQEIFP